LSNKKITQKYLANKAGVAESAITKWKKTGEIRPENIIQICHLFDTQPPAWLKPDRKPIELNPESVVRFSSEIIERINSDYEEGALTTDDIALISQIASRLAGKNQKIKKLEALLAEMDASNDGQTKA